MAKSIDSVLLLTFALLFVRADEHERWNTPPELTPESVKILNNEEPQTRLFSFVPTATVSLNAGNNNAHSVSLGASLDGISLSESNTYNHPTGYGLDGSSVSVSKSATVSAGLSGISTASAEAHSNGNNAKTESHSFSFGQATATSFGTIENGQTITGAISSAGSSQSSTTGGNRRQFSQTGAVNARYPYWPTWSNIGPNNGHNDQRFNRPTLTVSKPCDETRPTLNIDAPDAFRREQNPTIHIYKWRPNHRVSRPSFSIEHQLDDSRNGRIHGSTNLQIESKDSKQGYSDGDLISDLAQTVGELLDIV
ncbi:epidermal growth factor receptor substrate 15 homolog isoform X1 [Temnothorax curvispinosus]|uniref:Epidermal growth factor receptor substrate 15 homolog isoform X1 n=1 Tax=Temnothorax curvispinosus TaxID=300111 RepID=A0A6J1QV63_9HYME|nr:epidermal growth factor receptor substrate 15 homolog isoform X1 [Temnothorax curvispinosus]XP_024885763.1 epidermal growth factor receptor substrate 15 homolog isoform X1 [Temnothorax curvispinosus]